MQAIDQLKQLLSSPKKIMITTHQKPDADALGSSLAWGRYLRKKGHDVTVIAPTDFPAFLNWMEGVENVIIHNEGNEARSARIIEEADVVFCLDFSALSRINDLGRMVGESKAKKVLIDHHLEPEDFADISFWDTKSAATAVLIYEIIVALGDRAYIDPYIAECIYAGIMTDTGSFRHSSTNKQVHLIVADLIELKVNITRVHRLIYDTNSEERMRFLGFCLSERLIINREYCTAYMPISKEDLQKFHSQTGDTEGVVNYALSIDGIVLAAVIIERPDGVKLSFRSKGDFSVNEFARKNFEGGGHRNAAGGRSPFTMAETVKKFEDALPVYKQELLDTFKSEKYLC